MEKLLFQKKNDYLEIGELLKKNTVKTWVNCSMRSMPFYSNLTAKLKTPFTYHVSGGQYGLVTNAIHYLDHLCFLVKSLDFQVDVSALDKKIISSKRKGFLELNGAILIRFQKGALGIIDCFAKANAPLMIEISSPTFRCISRENEQKAWISEAPDWQWREVEAVIPYQSERTSKLVDDILLKEKCVLPTFIDAVKMHLALLEPVKKFVNQNSHKKYNYYPFT